MASDFRVVSDSLREDVTVGRSSSAINQALKDGRTVFLPHEWESTEGKKLRNRLNSSADYYGLRMRSGPIEIDGESGILVWWEARE